MARRRRKTLNIGSYEQAITAALAYDLAERALGNESSGLNFSDGMLEDLLPVFGEDVVAGLNPRLPAALRAAIAARALAD